jgi:hypothetical protein
MSYGTGKLNLGSGIDVMLDYMNVDIADIPSAWLAS